MKFLFGLILSFATVLAAENEPTAFELMKEGNRYVGEQAKDKVVQARSEKSIGSLSPKTWFIVYYDPTATFKSVEVKFAAGKMVDVKRPFRLLETVGGGDREMDKDKLKIDSDKAIEIALKEPILADVKVRSVEAKLENSASGPVWRIRMWAERLNNSRKTEDIGRITLTADEGTVTEADVHLDRLD